MTQRGTAHSSVSNDNKPYNNSNNFARFIAFIS